MIITASVYDEITKWSSIHQRQKRVNQLALLVAGFYVANKCFTGKCQNEFTQVSCHITTSHANCLIEKYYTSAAKL